MFRSLRAVVLGYVAIFVSTMVAMLLLTLAFGLPLMPSESQAKPVSPPALFSIISLALGVPCAMLGGWVASRVAPKLPLRHALALALFMLLMGLGYAASSWNGIEPRWYLGSMPFLGAAGAMLGGRLGVKTRAVAT